VFLIFDYILDLESKMTRRRPRTRNFDFEDDFESIDEIPDGKSENEVIRSESWLAKLNLESEKQGQKRANKSAEPTITFKEFLGHISPLLYMFGTLGILFCTAFVYTKIKVVEFEKTDIYKQHLHTKPQKVWREFEDKYGSIVIKYSYFVEGKSYVNDDKIGIEKFTDPSKVCYMASQPQHSTLIPVDVDCPQ
jgi:hypothetical protein